MSNNHNSRISRSEKLFDNLKSKDSKIQSNNPVSESNYNKEKKINFDEKSGEGTSEKEIETITEGDKVAESDVDIVGTLKYKGLQQQIDNQTCISEHCAGLQSENNFALRCQSALNLAANCCSQLSDEDFKSIFDALNVIPYHHEFYALSFCEALLLYILTKQTLTPEQFVALENCILKVSHSVIRHEGIMGNSCMEARIVLLGGERYLTAYKLCKEIFSKDNLDLNSLDVSTICCASLRSLSKVRVLSIGRSKFSDGTLKYVICMIGKSTQEIISENLIDMEEDGEISISSYTVNQCLQVLEQILTADPSSPCKTLDHEEYSLFRCLTKLLEWNISALFPLQNSENVLFKVQNSLHAFYLSTLVSLLKVFSVLSYDPDQYDYYTNAKGTIEKIMVCILKIYFQSEENHFDVLVLALELLINFSLKCKKTFVLVCLKKFQNCVSEDMPAIEALIKILDFNLQKISKIKSSCTAATEIAETGGSDDFPAEQNIDLVLKAAGEDMELSTIVSFIGILLTIFLDTKKTFLEFIRERLSIENCTEAATVSKKFLQVALLTGEMPATGILLLRASIMKLNQLHQSS